MSYYNILDNIVNTHSFDTNENPKCSSNRYECLETIYKNIKSNSIFKNVLAYIQGGFALYLYGYKDIMIKNPIVGTDDIDIHIESTDTTPPEYNILLQKAFIKLCNKFGNKKGINQIKGKWYYGTSQYMDITYKDNYISLEYYKSYCKEENGYTDEKLYEHLNTNLSNLLLPLEYVKFNCIHMFCILLHAFNTQSINNRVPKTLKILKRVLMIYDYENYELFVSYLDNYIEQILKLILHKNKKIKSNIETEMNKINKFLIDYYISFISKKDYSTTQMLLFILKKLNTNPIIYNGGGKNNNNNKNNINSTKIIFNECFYTETESKKITHNDIIINNLCALIFKNIIINDMTPNDITKSIIQYFNIDDNSIQQGITHNTRMSIQAYGGYRKYNTTKHKIKQHTKYTKYTKYTKKV